MYQIKRLVTIQGVMVDSVAGTTWEAHKGGIHEIRHEVAGVRIMWVAGTTFVPYSNVRFTHDVWSGR